LSKPESHKIRLELLEDVYKAETQIDKNRGISHENARRMVMKSI